MSAATAAFDAAIAHALKGHYVNCRDNHTGNEAWLECEAAMVTGALAGRLLPEGTTRHEQFGVRVLEPHPRRKEKPGEIIRLSDARLALAGERIWAGWQPVRRELYVTEWLELRP